VSRPDRTHPAVAAMGIAFPDDHVLDVMELSGGHTSRNWVVTTPTRRLLVKQEKRGARYANVAAAITIARAAGLRTPALRHVGRDDDIGRFAVLDFIEGRRASDLVPQLGADDRSRFFLALARQCRTLHSASVDPFANAATGHPAFATWGALIDDRVAAIPPRYAAAGVPLSEDVQRAMDRLRALGERVSPAVEPALVHHDVYLENVLVTPSGEPVLIDFEHAKIWDPLADWAKLELLEFPRYPDAAAAFAEGYGLAAVPYEAERRAIAVGLEIVWGIPYFVRWGDAAIAARFGEALRPWLVSAPD
jgi:aminoglycoside phosphotransferase (APT) family kinase protein